MVVWLCQSYFIWRLADIAKSLIFTSVARLIAILLSNIVRWAIADPHFMSAKLLNASSWDDVQESGELSSWTIRQRCITIRLLSDTLDYGTGQYQQHVTVAALQSLLAFEVCFILSDLVDISHMSASHLDAHRQ